jgi:hypothetical protein
MPHALRVHPDFPSPEGVSIDVSVERTAAGALHLRYTLTGAGKVLIPRRIGSLRADNLWQHTCFEAFVRPAGGTIYFEFNFAPSLQWAIYHFDAPRQGMRNAAELGVPILDIQSEGARFELGAEANLGVIPGLANAAWQLNLTAVIEEPGGRKSYWALAHPAGRPDFHNPDCFALELPAA